LLLLGGGVVAAAAAAAAGGGGREEETVDVGVFAQADDGRGDDVCGEIGCCCCFCFGGGLGSWCRHSEYRKRGGSKGGGKWKE